VVGRLDPAGTAGKGALATSVARFNAAAEAIFVRPWLAAILVGVLVAAPSFLLVGAVVGDTTEQIQLATIEEQERAAQTGADIVATRLNGLRDNLVAVAGSQIVRDAMARKDPRLLDIIVHEFRPVLGLQSDVLVLFVEDARGDLLAISPAEPALIGMNFAARDYFIGVTRDWKPFVSEAFRGAVQSSPPTTVVAVPLFTTKGEPAGVLGAALDLSQAARWFAPLSGYDDVYLFDRSGRLIVHTLDPLGDSLRELGSDPSVRAAMSGTRVLGEASDPLGRGTKLLASAPVPGVDWHVVVTADPTSLDAAFSPLVRNILTVRIALVVLILLLTLMLSRVVRGLVAQRVQLEASERAARAAREEADGANKHKSEFLANMSHELRTPLNAIIGFSDLLQEQLATTLTERQKRYLHNIRDGGDHLLRLINDVLDLSKVEAGRIEVRPEPITLEALLSPVLAAAREAAQTQAVHLEVAEPDDHLRLHLDPGRVRQVLYNLLSNAIKFTPAGGRVELRVWTDDSALELVVADSGIGIPAEKHDRVFGTFERLNEARSHASGTGLGLALTKRLVELHGGSIDFDSREGHGSTFRVRLPDVVVDPTKRQRVLIVEDERRDADLVIALAAKYGLVTEVVTSVADAATAIGRAIPCAVVLDLQLPDGRGERVLELLKGDQATRRVPVIVVSVEDDEGTSRPLGADDHLTKPIDHARLDGWFRQVASRGKTEVALAAAAR